MSATESAGVKVANELANQNEGKAEKIQKGAYVGSGFVLSVAQPPAPDDKNQVKDDTCGKRLVA